MEAIKGVSLHPGREGLIVQEVTNIDTEVNNEHDIDQSPLRCYDLLLRVLNSIFIDEPRHNVEVRFTYTLRALTDHTSKERPDSGSEIGLVASMISSVAAIQE